MEVGKTSRTDDERVSNREERMTLDHASPVRQGNIEEGERSELKD